MTDRITNHAVSFYELEWDTKFFGVSCAKAVLNEPLDMANWHDLKARFKDYQFVSIENRNSEPINAQLIGRDTCAFLADVNIQFSKRLESEDKVSDGIVICQALERNGQLLEIADFGVSRFTEDPELLKRCGDQVYRQWLINSFGHLEKHFAISKDNKGMINGFLLHSFTDNACVVELIAVSSNEAHSGIGTKLFNAVENSASKRGFSQLRVGTQVRNIAAINFYHKVGCKQVGCHQVYHLWNLLIM